MASKKGALTTGTGVGNPGTGAETDDRDIGAASTGSVVGVEASCIAVVRVGWQVFVAWWRAARWRSRSFWTGPQCRPTTGGVDEGVLEKGAPG